MSDRVSDGERQGLEQGIVRVPRYVAIGKP